MASGSGLESKSKSPALADADAAAETGLSIGDLLMMLRRHLLFIIACIAICTLAALLYVRSATPIYEATAKLRLDPGRTTSLGLSDLGGSEGSQDSLSTEIAIIQGDSVAIATLHSLSDADFLKFTGKPKNAYDLIPGSTKLTPAQELILAHLQGSLSAKEVEGTQIVAVSVRDPDPAMAALLANRVVDAYLLQSVRSRVNSADEVTRRLSDQLDTLRKNAEESQRRLADFEEKNNIVGTDSANGASTGNTTTDRLRLLNTSLAQAQANRIIKEAQMQAVAGHPAVLASLYPNPQLTALESEQGRLYGEAARLSSKYGPKYPPLEEINAELKKLQVQIDANTANQQNSLKQEYDAAVATEKLLQAQYAEQEKKAYAINRQEADYSALQSEVSASRDLYMTLQRKLQQAGVNAGLAAVNTMLLENARIPLLPLEPKKQTILGFGLLLGLFVGVGVAFLMEAAQDKIQNREQLERSVHIPLLASIPHLKAKVADDTPVILASPGSLDAESYHYLRNVLALKIDSSSPQAILFTESLPSEGCSTIAANYAIAVAQGGSRVLLVDANLRNAGLHQQFGVSGAERGLGELLSDGDTQIPYLLPVAALPNLFLLPAGKKVSLPSVLLGSSRFASLLRQWKTEFDVIVLDSSPLLSVSDSIPLCALADVTVLVARYNFTRLKSLKQVRSVLIRSKAEVAGVILNDAPADSVEQGGYVVA